MVERGEAKCEYKRFDDCDHFDFSFRMRYPKPTVNANAAMIATERKKPNVNANTVMTANNSISFSARPFFLLHQRLLFLFLLQRSREPYQAPFLKFGGEAGERRRR